MQVPFSRVWPQYQRSSELLASVLFRLWNRHLMAHMLKTEQEGAMVDQVNAHLVLSGALVYGSDDLRHFITVWRAVHKHREAILLVFTSMQPRRE
jgi:hypothetical protein